MKRNTAGPTVQSVKKVKILFLWFILTITPLCQGQDWQTLKNPVTVKFPSGYDIIDQGGKILKSFTGNQTATVQAYRDTKQGRFFISDWSYQRAVNQGIKANWIRARAAATQQASPNPPVQPSKVKRRSNNRVAPTSTPPEKRVAILIGNANYQASPLDNPVNDVQDLAKQFTSVGFETVLLSNADARAMKFVLANKADTLREATCVVYHYAGHGFQAGGENYLVPVDFPLDDSAGASLTQAVTLGSVLSDLEKYTSAKCVKMVVLDCCRNNPFTESPSSNGEGRSISGKRIAKGMAAPASTPRGTILCFATDPGQVALDGEGRNSPYAVALKTHLFDRGVEVNEALRRVGSFVQRNTGDSQNPWRNTNFNGEFFVVPTVQRSYDTRMEIIMDRESEKVRAKFISPLAVGSAGIAGENAGDLFSETVINIPSITGKGILGPSHDPNDQSGFQNAQGTLFGFNLRPATKTSYPYLFYRDQNGQIHLIANLPVRAAKVLPNSASIWKGWIDSGRFLQIEKIAQNVVTLYSMAWDDASKKVEIRFSLTVDSRGSVSYVGQ